MIDVGGPVRLVLTAITIANTVDTGAGVLVVVSPGRIFEGSGTVIALAAGTLIDGPSGKLPKGAGVVVVIPPGTLLEGSSTVIDVAGGSVWRQTPPIGPDAMDWLNSVLLNTKIIKFTIISFNDLSVIYYV